MTGNKVFPPRMPEQLRIAIEKRAEERLRSINNEIVILLKLGLANQYEESEAIKSADKLLAQNKKDR